MMIRDLFMDSNDNYIDLPNGCRIHPIIIQKAKSILDAMDIYSTIIDFTKEMPVDDLTAIYILAQIFYKKQSEECTGTVEDSYASGLLQGILLGKFIKNTNSEIVLESVKLTTTELMHFMQNMPGRPSNEE